MEKSNVDPDSGPLNIVELAKRLAKQSRRGDFDKLPDSDDAHLRRTILEAVVEHSVPVLVMKLNRYLQAGKLKATRYMTSDVFDPSIEQTQDDADWWLLDDEQQRIAAELLGFASTPIGADSHQQSAAIAKEGEPNGERAELSALEWEVLESYRLPALTASAPTSGAEGAKTRRKGVWWMQDYQVHSIAQLAGQRLFAKGNGLKKPGIDSIAREVADTIARAERIKNPLEPREAPQWGTVKRHGLRGWKFKPEPLDKR